MSGSTTPPHSDTISPAGSACGHWRDRRVFGSYSGNHITRFINGAVSLSGKRFFTATNTLATPVIIDFLPTCSSGAARLPPFWIRHRGTSLAK